MAQCHKRAFVTPPSQGDLSTRIAPNLTRIWSEDRPARVPPPGLAWQDSTAQCQRSTSHSAHFSAAAYRTPAA